jgi:hypothetical protein
MAYTHVVQTVVETPAYLKAASSLYNEAARVKIRLIKGTA